MFFNLFKKKEYQPTEEHKVEKNIMTINAYPFVGAYVSSRFTQYDPATGEIFNDGRYYFADKDVLEKIIFDMSRLESMLSYAQITSTIPKLSSDLSLLTYIDPNNFDLASWDGYCESCPHLIIEDKRYPNKVIVSCHNFTERSSHAYLWYSNEGALGKATVHYHLDVIHHTCRYSSKKGELYLQRVIRDDLYGKVTLF